MNSLIISNENSDNVAFSQMVLIALSHDFVTPFKAAIRCCNDILRKNSENEVLSEKTIELVLQSKAAIRDIYPELGDLHDSAQKLKSKDPLTMVQFLSENVDPKISKPVLLLKKVESDIKNRGAAYARIASDLSITTRKINNMTLMLRQTVNDNTNGTPRTKTSIKTTLHEIRTLFQRAGSPTVLTVHGNVRLDANSGQMWSVFSNLYGNAIKYSKADTTPRIVCKIGQPTNIYDVAKRVSFRAQKEYAPGYEHYKYFVKNSKDIDDWIEIQFIDFGVGIPEDRIWGVFKLFKQLDQDDKESVVEQSPKDKNILTAYSEISDRKIFSGIGMGLALCQYFIRSHGGELVLDSQLGGPTTFSVFLPNPSSKGDLFTVNQNLWWYSQK